MPGTTTGEDRTAHAASSHPGPTTPSPTSPRNESSAGPCSAASSANTSGPAQSPGHARWHSSGTPQGQARPQARRRAGAAGRRPRGRDGGRRRQRRPGPQAGRSRYRDGIGQPGELLGGPGGAAGRDLRRHPADAGRGPPGHCQHRTGRRAFALELPPVSVCAWVACVVLAAIAGLTLWRCFRTRRAALASAVWAAVSGHRGGRPQRAQRVEDHRHIDGLLKQRSPHRGQQPGRGRAHRRQRHAHPGQHALQHDPPAAAGTSAGRRAVAGEPLSLTGRPWTVPAMPWPGCSVTASGRVSGRNHAAYRSASRTNGACEFSASETRRMMPA